MKRTVMLLLGLWMIPIQTVAFHHGSPRSPASLVLHDTRRRRRMTFLQSTTISTAQSSSLTRPICEYHILTIPCPESLQADRPTSSTTTATTTSPAQPLQEIHVTDITPAIHNLLQQTGMQQGLVTVTSRHTTTGMTVNEYECRLIRDMQHWLLQLAPPDERSAAAVSKGKHIRYQHNDIDQRPESADELGRCVQNGWTFPAQLQAWRDQEPVNAHSHLLSMLLGATVSIPVVDSGTMTLGSWQSILLVDMDGPRERTVGVQFLGYL